MPGATRGHHLKPTQNGSPHVGGKTRETRSFFGEKQRFPVDFAVPHFGRDFRATQEGSKAVFKVGNGLFVGKFLIIPGVKTGNGSGASWCKKSR